MMTIVSLAWATKPVAIDLLTDIGAGRIGRGTALSSGCRMFPRFQAELDNLPFCGGQFDLVIFNSSFHYWETVKEHCGGDWLYARPRYRAHRRHSRGIAMS